MVIDRTEPRPIRTNKAVLYRVGDFLKEIWSRPMSFNQFIRLQRTKEMQKTEVTEGKRLQYQPPLNIKKNP
jgi:hypothetical protein